MAKEQKTPKKTIRKEIEKQLLVTFEHLRNEVGPDKLKRRVRKASKILSAGIKPAAPVKKAKVKTLEIKKDEAVAVAE